MTLRLWPGETVQARVAFTWPDGRPMVATGGKIQARLRGSSTVIDAQVVPAEDNSVGVFLGDFGVDIAGTWAVRASCTGPSPSATEEEFTVAKSLVLVQGVP